MYDEIYCIRNKSNIAAGTVLLIPIDILRLFHVAFKTRAKGALHPLK